MTTVRNYIPGEWLPWSTEDIGWAPGVIDPQLCWVVFVDGKIEGFLLAAQVMNSLLLIRLLGTGNKTWWIRPLWREVRRVCDNHGIAGFWFCMDNQRETECRLGTLMREGRTGIQTLLVREAQGVWISGRFATCQPYLPPPGSSPSSPPPV